MLRSACHALCAGVLLLCLPAVAAADPPSCESAYLIVSPGDTLDLPDPSCSDPDDDNGEVSVIDYTQPDEGEIDEDAWTYTPPPGFHDFDYFTYTVADEDGETAGPFTVTVSVNTPPECRTVTATVQAGGTLALPELPCFDANNDDYDIYLDEGKNGTVNYDAQTFTPAPGFVGTETLTFYAEDEYFKDRSDPDGTLTITVTAVQPAPTPTPTPLPPPPPPIAKPEQITSTLAYSWARSGSSTRFSNMRLKNVPSGATVTVRCVSGTCPSALYKKAKGKRVNKTLTLTGKSGTVALTALTKSPAKSGAVIEIAISKPGAIAAIKRLTMRKGKAPTLTSRCLPPGAKRPVAC